MVANHEAGMTNQGNEVEEILKKMEISKLTLERTKEECFALRRQTTVMTEDLATAQEKITSLEAN